MHAGSLSLVYYYMEIYHNVIQTKPYQGKLLIKAHLLLEYSVVSYYPSNKDMKPGVQQHG